MVAADTAGAWAWRAWRRCVCVGGGGIGGGSFPDGPGPSGLSGECGQGASVGKGRVSLQRRYREEG